MKASLMAQFLDRKLTGADREILGVSSLYEPIRNTLVYCLSRNNELATDVGALVLVPDEFQGDHGENCIIRVDNPRLAFAQLVEAFFVEQRAPGISPQAYVAEDITLGEDCRIDHGAVLESGVVLGDRCRVGYNTVVHSGCQIGADCIIGPNATLGSDGLSMERDNDGRAVRIRHLGGIVIGGNVEIGANSTVQRGTIGDTVIEDGVKTSPNVNIGHNCYVGYDVVIASGACLCGGARLGARVFIGAGAVVREGINIGADAFVGMQASVVAHLGEGEKVVGVTGLSLSDLVKFKRLLGQKAQRMNED